MTLVLESKYLTASHFFSLLQHWELEGQVQPRGRTKYFHTFRQNDKKKLNIYTIKVLKVQLPATAQISLLLPNKICSKIVKMLNWTFRAGQTACCTYRQSSLSYPG